MPARRTPLRPQSDKRRAIAPERRAFVDDVLRRRPRCEAHSLLLSLALIAGAASARSVDVHELRRRSQGSPIVPSQGLTDDDVLAVCRQCHDWITTNPAEAVSLGFACWGMRRE